MKKMSALFVGCVLALLTAVPALAGPVKVYVAEMNAVGIQNRDEMKQSLQALLASRLSSGTVLAVANPAEADVTVNGTYVAIAGIFNIDAVAVLPGNRTLTRVSVQGDNQNQLVSAIGKLAEKLLPELEKVPPAPVAPAAPAAGRLPAAALPVAAAPRAGGDVVPIRETYAGSRSSWKSQQLSGNMTRVAAGSVAADGSREVFLADNQHLYHYRKDGKTFKKLAEKPVAAYERIISLDAMDAVGGGTDLYVTVIGNEKLMSQVWHSKNGVLKLIADNQPYFFRTASFDGGPSRLYLQAMGPHKTFGEPVQEAVRNGSKVELKTRLNLPKNLSLYSFGQFRDTAGAVHTVVLAPDSRRLIVYDRELQELWRSAETYGGSELYMRRRDMDTIGLDDEPRIYIGQRLQITRSGEVLVGKNDRLPLLGDKGYLSNGRVYSFVWNGADLEGRWHTRSTENYMPDFWYDDAARELLQLDLTGRPMLIGKGTTVLHIRNVE
jgi:hypothetical protein